MKNKKDGRNRLPQHRSAAIPALTSHSRSEALLCGALSPHHTHHSTDSQSAMIRPRTHRAQRTSLVAVPRRASRRPRHGQAQGQGQLVRDRASGLQRRGVEEAKSVQRRGLHQHAAQRAHGGDEEAGRNLVQKVWAWRAAVHRVLWRRWQPHSTRGVGCIHGLVPHEIARHVALPRWRQCR